MSSAPAGETLYLLDAYSLIFQVFHALPEMSSPAGAPTNALFGFTRDLLYLRDEKKPDFLVCVFDAPGPTFRDTLYPAYKAHRAPMPDDLQQQIPQIHRLLEAMSIPELSKEGYEADDLIATIATEGARRGMTVFICTADKDFRQLISDRIRLFNLRKHQVFDEEGLRTDWGIRPNQVVDLQTLVGDSVDNIPGVPGVGVKTAAKLLNEYGDLNNLLAHLDEVKGVKTRESIRSAAAEFPLSRTLVRLKRDVPLEVDWERWRLRPADARQALALFQEWGFRRFAEQMRLEAPPVADAPGSPAARQGKLFNDFDAGSSSPVADVPGSLAPALPWEPTGVYRLVDDPERFAEFLAELGRQRRFALDLETTALDPASAELVGYAFCWQTGQAWYVPVRGLAETPVLDADTVLEQLRPILEDPRAAKVNQNIKYDSLVLRRHGVELAGIAGDPMVADYLLHAGERSHNLDSLAQRYFGHAMIPITDLIGKGKGQRRMDEVPPAQVAEYAGEDADAAWRLCELLESQLQQQGLAELYHNLEVPLIQVLAELEFNGIRIDVELLNRLGAEMKERLAGIEQEIYQLAGRPFNIASPQQLRQILFDEMKLRPQRKTTVTGAASTAQATLEKLAAQGHELPKKLLEHRQLAKLKGTYVDALPQLVNPRTGRIHASFNQTVTATGRLSSSDPNLQNIPVRSEEGRRIRQAFVPEQGWILLAADYSQIELRLLAHFSGDPDLRRAFIEDQDIHAAVAAQIFRVAVESVTSEQRRVAKTVNFGVLYGMSAHGLAQRLGMHVRDAERFIRDYFARYPRVLEYQSRVLERCLRTSYAQTILGRRRQVSGIRSDSTYQQRNQPEREAINMEIQGSAADLIKKAMVNIHRRLQTEKRRTRMLLQIHDELVFETPPEELRTVAPLVVAEMTTALPLEVPLKVDIAAGPNWLDVEEIA